MTPPGNTAGPPTALRFAALGDSLTSGVGDPLAGGRRRGWAALLCGGAGGTDAVAPVAVSALDGSRVGAAGSDAGVGAVLRAVPGEGVVAVAGGSSDAVAGVSCDAARCAGPDAGAGVALHAVAGVGANAGVGAAFVPVSGSASDAAPGGSPDAGARSAVLRDLGGPEGGLGPALRAVPGEELVAVQGGPLAAVAGVGCDAAPAGRSDAVLGAPLRAVPCEGPVAVAGPGEGPGSVTAGERVVAFHNFAVSGALTRDVEEQQAPAALAFRPDLASVVVGVNDTLRRAFDIQDVALRLDRICGELAAHGTVLLTACLPDPGTMLGLPGPLARPLARRQRAVNAVVHALSERYDSVHLHMSDDGWVADRSLWSADRLHPGERGHRLIAARFHELLAERGFALGPPPALTTDRPPPSRLAAWRWLATAGTGWVLRRCRDLLPDLLRLAADEVRHRARGTAARLDQRAELALSRALAALTPAPAVQRPTCTTCAAPAGSAALTTAITG